MAVRTRRAAAATYQPLTLQDCKDHMRVTTADAGQDARISMALLAAVLELENLCQRTLCETQWVATLDSFPTAIKLPMAPILAVSQIKYKDISGTLQTLAPSQYAVDTVSEPGFVVPAPNITWPDVQDGAINAVSVFYTAGYASAPATQAIAAASVPAPLRQWLLIRVATLFENRESISFASAPFEIQQLDALIDTYKIREV